MENKLAAHKTKADQRKLIQKLKKALKKEEAFLSKCEEYDKDPDFIHEVHVSFEPLDVSAKTVNGKIFLNQKLFEQGDWHDQMRYLVHEMTHVMQQEAGVVDGTVDKEDYLDDKNEQEAFQVQLEYMDDNTPEEVQDYIEQLMDHHDIKGKERRRKIRLLTKDI